MPHVPIPSASTSTATATATAILQHSTPILVRRTTAWLVASGIFAANPNPKPDTHLPPQNDTASTTTASWRKKKPPTQESSPPSPHQKKSQLLNWNQHDVTRWLLLPTLATYLVYPVMMLLLFRLPEQISWLGMFQHSHRCRVSGEMNHCLQLYATHSLLLGGMVLSSFWLYKFRTWKGWGLYFAVFLLGVGVCKACVDEWALYHPPSIEASSSSSSLHGKVALITGANRGIGRATAYALADRGAHVIVTCRSMAKCQPVLDHIHAHTPGSATAAVLDLTSLESAYHLVQEVTELDGVSKIHYIFCNAGTTPQYALTAEGFEDGFGGMHLAHMALVLGLLPSLERAGTIEDPARVVVVSSEMAINGAIGIFGENLIFSAGDGNGNGNGNGGGDTDDMEDDWRGEGIRGDGTIGASLPAYARAKLCSVLFALELNQRLARQGVSVIAHAVHTGAVVTASSREAIVNAFPKQIPFLSWLVGNVYFPLLWRSVEGGARALLCPALSRAPYILEGGQYLDALCRPFLHDKDIHPNRKDTITIPFFGSWTINTDPVQALLLADIKWSKRLWSVSLAFLQDSPAHPVVALAP